VLSSFLGNEAPKLLRQGGRLAFVIVAPLAEKASEYCSAAGFRLIAKVSTKNHSVFVYEKSAGASPAPRLWRFDRPPAMHPKACPPDSPRRAFPDPIFAPRAGESWGVISCPAMDFMDCLSSIPPATPPIWRRKPWPRPAPEAW
jgi:hypothetical protein